MERPSCVGCLLTSSILIVFFTALISVILNRIFKVGAFDGGSALSVFNFGSLFMAHKTLVATSFMVALLPTFYFAATINDIYVKYKTKKEKEMEAAVQEYQEEKERKNYKKTLPKPNADQIDPSKFKPPSKSIPKNLQKNEEPKDKE